MGREDDWKAEAQQQAESAMSAAAEKADRLRGELDGFLSGAREWIEEFPLTALALAVAGGYVTGRIVGRV